MATFDPEADSSARAAAAASLPCCEPPRAMATMAFTKPECTARSCAPPHPHSPSNCCVQDSNWPAHRQSLWGSRKQPLSASAGLTAHLAAQSAVSPKFGSLSGFPD